MNATLLKTYRRRFGYLILLVAVLYFSFHVILYFKGPSPRARACSALGNIGAYLGMYNDVHGNLPPATANANDFAVSWRAVVAPYEDGYKGTNSYRVDKPWHDPANSQFAERHAHLFCHDIDSPLHTSYMAVTGPGTAFEQGREYSLYDIPPQLVIVMGVNDSGTHWMQPKDLSVNETDEVLARQIRIPNIGIVVLFADQHVWVLDESTPIEKLRRFFTVSEAQNHDRENVLGAYRLFP